MAIGKNAVRVPKCVPMIAMVGKYDVLKYIREFDKLNGLKFVDYKLGEKK